ncbi:unnamed protein product [Linum tenue]|uniref:Neprosin PEP catalytic domain-containing protein n=1 Tax=Linum tenue TaxID=586396 RepID=A0AAV0S6C3_9ROSI|nr:unnamed protein product [Linum tenue]
MQTMIFPSDSLYLQINPGLYGDTATRHFIYTSTKDSHCYNTFCPGFVIMSPDVPLDAVLQASERGNNIRAQKIFVRKDAASGDWFLQIGLDNTTGEEKHTLPLPTPRIFHRWVLGSRLVPSSMVMAGKFVDENQQVDYNSPECVMKAMWEERSSVLLCLVEALVQLDHELVLSGLVC